MKYVISLLFILFASFSSFGQSVTLAGTIFDPSGALVTNGQIKAVDEKGSVVTGASNSEGRFEIKLVPGIYSLEISAPGFLTIKNTEFLVVNSRTGMVSDFVLFGGKYHEPCGYGGDNCLPAKSLIQSYEVRYSPKLKDIRDEFAPISTSRDSKKRID
ncbi:MAG: carboxypeptidase-like regulatory domain-containing protein [Pyrinomonadaceae bacterium]